MIIGLKPSSSLTLGGSSALDIFLTVFITVVFSFVITIPIVGTSHKRQSSTSIYIEPNLQFYDAGKPLIIVSRPESIFETSP